MKTKVCKTCGCSKLVTDFHKNGSSKTGRQNYTAKCKDCLADARRDLAAERRRSCMESKAVVDVKLNAILANNSADLNEKYITFNKTRRKYNVQMDGKYHGSFYTIEGARKKKAELLERREANKTEKRIQEIQNQIVVLTKELEELRCGISK